MNFTLYVGDYAYSSWSLRGWLLLDAFGIGFDLRHAHMRTEGFRSMVEEMAPARLVPTLAIDDGVRGPVMVWETLAIAETVHDYFPKAGLWPAGERVRPVARALAAEMHAGFGALRAACPMNLRCYYDGFAPGEAVLADLARLEELWAHARSRAAEGPYLFGPFSAVDAFYAPVVSRLASYALPVSERTQTYIGAVMAHPSVRRWRAMAMADPYRQEHYHFDLPLRADPFLPEVTGVATEEPAANAVCPFSGAGALHAVRIRDRVLGFGDPFTRDKVAADPLAWPEVAALLQSG